MPENLRRRRHKHFIPITGHKIVKKPLKNSVPSFSKNRHVKALVERSQNIPFNNVVRNPPVPNNNTLFKYVLVNNLRRNITKHIAATDNVNGIRKHISAEEIFKKPAITDDESQLKRERLERILDKYADEREYYNCNMKQTMEFLVCLPFYERNDIDPSLFSRRQIESMKQSAFHHCFKHKVEGYGGFDAKDRIYLTKNLFKYPTTILDTVNLKGDCPEIHLGGKSHFIISDKDYFEAGPSGTR